MSSRQYFWPSFMLLLLFSIVRVSYAQEGGPPKTFRDCPDCPEMVVIPPGSSLMGSTDEDTKRDLAAIPPTTGLPLLFGDSDHGIAARYMQYEHPQHVITIAKPFAMGRTPVTRGEFAAFVKETGYKTGLCRLVHLGRPTPPVASAWEHPYFDQSDQDPVVCVTWDDANAYIAWLNGKLSHSSPTTDSGPYRLPTEAEWEYAARGWTQTAWWWGNEVGTDHALCNGCNVHRCIIGWKPIPGVPDYSCHGPMPELPVQHTIPVRKFQPNPFRLYDMFGNVSEFVEDCWHENYVGAPTDGSVWNGGDCSRRVTRGGSWHGLAWASRSATRAAPTMGFAENDIGFRVVMVLQQYHSP